MAVEPVRPPDATWTVVLPVKGGAGAKSRLRHPARAELARAFALDAVAAVLGCPSVDVLVVTGDDEVAADHARLGATVVLERVPGLASALRSGAAAARPDHGCALLLADLPCLRPQDVTRSLDRCAALLEHAGTPAGTASQVVVPDADGTGTVLLAALRPGRLRPRFGEGSAAAHARDAQVLVDVPVRLRHDVDSDDQLVAAVALGVGPRTSAVLAAQLRSTMAPRAASFSPKRS